MRLVHRDQIDSLDKKARTISKYSAKAPAHHRNVAARSSRRCSTGQPDNGRSNRRRRCLFCINRYRIIGPPSTPGMLNAFYRHELSARVMPAKLYAGRLASTPSGCCPGAAWRQRMVSQKEPRRGLLVQAAIMRMHSRGSDRASRRSLPSVLSRGGSELASPRSQR
jgi:hypothetical protein